jgi:hypothetical protein
VEEENPRFFVNDSWEEEYQTRLKHYKKVFTELYPDDFRWVIDGEQVKEMIRCEMQLIHLDREVVNEGTKQEDGFIFVPAHLLKQREDIRKALQDYRKGLMVVMETRKRNKVKLSANVDPNLKLKQALARANRKEVTP